SIIDDVPYCRQHVVPLTGLGQDLQRTATTPNLSYITPNTFNDGHDTDRQTLDQWLRQYVPLILASPAYRQDGMLIVTFDEADTLVGVPKPNQHAQEDTTACCGEIPGPNTASPGVAGPGGGRVGAVILSPF